MQGYRSQKYLGGLYRVNYPFAGVINDTPAVATAKNFITITASGTTHTKGAWTQLIASLANDAYGLTFVVSNPNTGSGNNSILMDIGVGAASSETVILPNITLGNVSDQFITSPFCFVGVNIAAGSRIAARTQAAAASQNVYVFPYFLEQQNYPPGGSAWTTYGAVTASSRGTLVTPANGNWGSWTSIAATSAAHSIVTASVGRGSITGGGTGTHLIELAYGPNTGALTSLGTCYFYINNARMSGGTTPPSWATPIASGETLWVRIAATHTTAVDVCLHAV